MQNRKNVTKRNVVLKIETYNRLEKVLLQLMKDKENPRITLDEAVNFLLDIYENRRKKLEGNA